MKWIAELAAVVVAAGASAVVPASSAGDPSLADAQSATSGVTRAIPVANQASKPKRGTRVKSGGSAFGRMLYSRRDQAIYAFDKESGKKSKCYGACAAAWPPVLTEGRPTAGGKVDTDLLGTTMRRNGTRQVTYGGHPLYYYAHEDRGEVLCHNVFGFGGLWRVVGPDGDPLD